MNYLFYVTYRTWTNLKKLLTEYINAFFLLKDIYYHTDFKIIRELINIYN